MLEPGISFLDGGWWTQVSGPGILEFPPVSPQRRTMDGAGTWTLDLGISPSLSQRRTMEAGPGIWILEFPPLSALSQRRTVGPGPGIWILEFPPLSALSQRWTGGAGTWNLDLHLGISHVSQERRKGRNCHNLNDFACIGRGPHWVENRRPAECMILDVLDRSALRLHVDPPDPPSSCRGPETPRGRSPP